MEMTGSSGLFDLNRSIQGARGGGRFRTYRSEGTGMEEDCPKAGQFVVSRVEAGKQNCSVYHFRKQSGKQGKIVMYDLPNRT